MTDDCPMTDAQHRIVTAPKFTAVWCLQSYEGNLAVNLTELGPQIPSDTHLYWYTAETGVSTVQRL